MLVRNVPTNQRIDMFKRKSDDFFFKSLPTLKNGMNSLNHT